MEHSRRNFIKTSAIAATAAAAGVNLPQVKDADAATGKSVV